MPILAVALVALVVSLMLGWRQCGLGRHLEEDPEAAISQSGPLSSLAPALELDRQQVPLAAELDRQQAPLTAELDHWHHWRLDLEAEQQAMLAGVGSPQ